VTKRFGDSVAVDGLTLDIPDGELLVLLGSSGCGKTTALRLVAGLEEVSEGTISIGDRVVNEIDPKDRDVAMVFQSYALYPHLSVARNIEFPLRQRGMAKEERAAKVKEAAVTLGLDTLLDRKPSQLSGGQRQRVALARAIVRDPQVFLMDEPLSNLDAALRVQTRADIVALQARLSTTTLYVTHDQVEAMTMGDRIAVMSHGVLQQVAAPEDLYARPANTFVAGFLGSPGMNLCRERSGAAVDDGVTVEVSGGSVPCPLRSADRRRRRRRGRPGAPTRVAPHRPDGPAPGRRDHRRAARRRDPRHLHHTRRFPPDRAPAAPGRQAGARRGRFASPSIPTRPPSTSSTPSARSASPARDRGLGRCRRRRRPHQGDHPAHPPVPGDGPGLPAAPARAPRSSASSPSIRSSATSS
jgi:ABC-type sugar transport system ATPase subunit